MILVTLIMRYSVYVIYATCANSWDGRLGYAAIEIPTYMSSILLPTSYLGRQHAVGVLDSIGAYLYDQPLFNPRLY